MNKNTIIFSTTLNFLITFVLLLISFIFLYSHENSTKSKQLFDRYRPIVQMINGKKLHFDENFNKSLSEMNYEVYASKEQIDSILSVKKNLIFEIVRHEKTFKIYEIDGKNFLLFDKFDKRILIKDLESQNFTNTIYIIFVFVTLLIVITFLDRKSVV